MCGNKIELSKNEMEWFEMKVKEDPNKFGYPRICKDCRQRRRMERNPKILEAKLHTLAEVISHCASGVTLEFLQDVAGDIDEIATAVGGLNFDREDKR